MVLGSACRRCRADIVWARTLAGRMMPLDPTPYDRADEKANVAVYRGADNHLHARVITPARPLAPHEQRAMPHFATCLVELAQRDKVPGVRSLARARAKRGR